MNLITWTPKRDNHVEGKYGESRLWIRLNKKDEVTGLYTKLGNGVQKYIPEDSDEIKLEYMQLRAECIIESHIKTNNE